MSLAFLSVENCFAGQDLLKLRVVRRLLVQVDCRERLFRSEAFCLFVNKQVNLLGLQFSPW
jgi:hypothetical protein